jgi:hypothetical protein
MIWLYARGDATMQIETRFNDESQTYEVIWHEADGSVRRETFGNDEELRSRLAVIAAALEAQRWRQSGPPTIDPNGWRIS